MKGIVLEVSKKNLLLLTEEGQFLKVNNKHNYNVQIGAEFDSNRTPIKNTKNRLAPYLAMMVLSSFLFVSGFAFYNMTYGYIHIDINPSVEIGYNYFGKIVKVKPLNEDGKLLLKGIKGIKGASIDNAIHKVIEEAKGTDFIKVDQEALVVVTFVDTKNRISEEEISAKVTEVISNYETLDIEFLEGTNEDYKEAKKEGKSTAQIIVNRAISNSNNEGKAEETQEKVLEKIAEKFSEKQLEKEEKEENKNKDAKEKENNNIEKEEKKDKEKSNKENNSSSTEKDNHTIIKDNVPVINESGKKASGNEVKDTEVKENNNKSNDNKNNVNNNEAKKDNKNNDKNSSNNGIGQKK